MTQRLTPRYMHISGAALVALDQGTADQPDTLEHVQKKLTVVNYVWNPTSLQYEVMVQPSTGSGAGSSSVDASLTSAGSTKLVGKVELSPTTPASSNDYLWVRTVGSAAGSTVVDANLSSEGSTKLVGIVGVNGTVSVTGTTAVTVNGQVGLSSGSSAVELTSAGSTRLVGQVTVANPTTSVSLSSQITASVTGTTSVNIANQPTVDLSSVGSTKLVGQMTVANPTTSVTVSSGVILGAGSTTNAIGSVALLAGTTGNSIGSVAIVAGSSANTLGNVAQGPGTSGTSGWVVDGYSFSSANTSRTSVSTTVDISIVAANSNRRALSIANLSTVQTVALGFSTAAVTTGLGNASAILGPLGVITFGGQVGTFPNYTGAIRGINITSTTVAGGVAVTQFTNT